MKISRLATGMIACALLAFLATDVMAQQRGGGQGGDGGGRQGGGRGGPGGFGGGRGGPGGFGGGGFGGGSTSLAVAGAQYLRIDEVKAEVELMPDQEEALKKMAESRPRGERPDIDFRNATEEQRTEFFAKMRKQQEEAAKKMEEQLEEVLLPDQLDRLKEIALQELNLNALTIKEVTEGLKMSEAQTKELADLRQKQRDERREKMMKLFQEVGREGMGEAFAKIQKENDEAILNVLTTQQKADFEKMKGKKFEMPESARRGFGGRGGPGGGRGGFGGRGGQGGAPGGGRGGDGGGRQRPAIEE